MTHFATMRTPEAPAGGPAPDGTSVRPLLLLDGGSFAHFELAPGAVSRAVRHSTVEETWYFLSGRGEMWRRQGEREEIVSAEAGVCLTVPLGTTFQFRSFGYEALTFVIMTMPPWPGDGEAFVVEGRWAPTIEETPRDPGPRPRTSGGGH